MFGDEPIIESNKIVIDVVDLAEDSSVIPIKVKANLESAEQITIVADKNPVPLVATFKLGQSVVDGYVATRIKLAGPSHVLVVVKANGKLYSAQKFVTVTNGGCG
jgi:sulfur-oxidizing protein SoxY